MEMIARAVKVEKGLYESTSPRRKVDADRVRQIIERDAPTSEPSRRDEPNNGGSHPSRDEQVNT